MNQLTDPSKSPLDNFREAIASRLVRDMNNLMPDDVLKQLVKEGTEKIIKSALHEKTSYGDTEDGFLMRALKTTLTHKTKLMLEELLEDEAFVKGLVKEAIMEKLPTLFFLSLTNNMSNKMDSAIINLEARLRSRF